MPNLIKGFIFDKSVKGDASDYFNIINTHSFEVNYKSKNEYAGYYVANLRPFVKYNVKFDFETDGEFMIDYTGANEDALPNELIYILE